MANIINIRLTDEVLTALRERAEAEERPLRSMAALLIKRALFGETTAKSTSKPPVASSKASKPRPDWITNPTYPTADR